MINWHDVLEIAQGVLAAALLTGCMLCATFVCFLIYHGIIR